MTTIQDQYTELLKQGQDAALAALQTCKKTFQQALDQLPHPGPVSPEHVIDQVYDFAGHLLNAQRDLAKQVLATSTAAAGRVRESVTPNS
jgi:hypothetical protein